MMVGSVTVVVVGEVDHHVRGSAASAARTARSKAFQVSERGEVVSCHGIGPVTSRLNPLEVGHYRALGRQRAPHSVSQNVFQNHERPPVPENAARSAARRVVGVPVTAVRWRSLWCGTLHRPPAQRLQCSSLKVRKHLHSAREVGESARAHGTR